MKTTKITVSLLILSLSISFSQNGWVQQNSGTENEINSCYFINDLTGYVSCNGGIILKTTNGGSQWLRVYDNPVYDMPSVYFVNVDTGWAAGVYLSSGTDSSIVIKTTNGGRSWLNYIVDTCGTIPFFDTDICFLNSLTGFLTGCSLRKTTDGGISWHTSLDKITSGVFFINDYTGWTGGFGYGISKTTDCGLTWQQQIPFLHHQYDTDFYFTNESSGFFVQGYFGNYGYLYRTTNSGVNWEQYYLPYEVSTISFPSENTGYVLASRYPNKYVSKTTNGGLSWTINNVNTTKYLRQVMFSSVYTGWVVGDSGLILKSTTGGLTINTNPSNPLIPLTFSLDQNYPNPFNPITTIKYELAENEYVKLAVYDLIGNEIAVLVNESLNYGTYEMDFDGTNLPSGTYFYRLWAGNYTQTKKMVLLK